MASPACHSLEPGEESTDSDDDDRRDLFTGVRIPAKNASASEVRKANREHLHEAEVASERLVRRDTHLPPSLAKAVDVMVAQGPSGVSRRRRAALARVEARLQETREESRRMYEKSPAHVQAVAAAASSEGLNPALVQHFVDTLGWHDKDLVGHLVGGFPLVGDLPVSGSAPEHLVRSPVETPADLLSRAPVIRAAMLAQQDNFSGRRDHKIDAEIFDQTAEEIRLGRMSELVEPDDGDLRGLPVTRRFGVVQQTSDGRDKIRCIDDFAASGVNDTTRVSRKIAAGRVSHLVEASRRLARGRPLEAQRLVKSDFKSAYRACPVDVQGLDFSVIAVRDPHLRRVRLSRQFAMPFGAVGAVYAWDRLAELVVEVLRREFDLPVARYVDDIFFVDFAGTAGEARDIILRVVDAFGLCLEVKKTPLPSVEMVVLGVRVRLVHSQTGAPSGIELGLDEDKRREWLRQAGDPAMSKAVAEKFLGRMEFAATAVFGPGPRSHLSSLYALVLGGDHSGLGDDLRWFRSFLRQNPQRSVDFAQPSQPPWVVYSDAEGRGGVGVFVATGSGYTWFPAVVPKSVKRLLRRRLTQIHLLEAIAVWVALASLRRLGECKRVVFFIDNQSALGALKKGRSSVSDLNAVVGLVHRELRRLGIEATFLRVPSKLNIADWPSRGRSPGIGTPAPRWTAWKPVVRALSAHCQKGFWVRVGMLVIRFISVTGRDSHDTSAVCLSHRSYIHSMSGTLVVPTNSVVAQSHIGCNTSAPGLRSFHGTGRSRPTSGRSDGQTRARPSGSGQVGSQRPG